MTDSIRIVEDFFKAWEALDEDAIVGAFTDDAVYHNMPLPPAQGKDAIRATIKTILAQAGDAVKFENRHIVAQGDVVLTERVDTFTMGDRKIVLEVMGTFELRDGKIAAWRDYFDLARWTKQAG